jgi:transposase
MLSLQDSRRYFMYKGVCDMRKSFDGLGGIVQQQMVMTLLSGDVFIFINKRRSQIKLLMWDGDGFCIYHKRLEKGTFELPSAAGQSKISLSALDLQLILSGIQLRSVKQRPRFKLRTCAQ